MRPISKRRECDGRSELVPLSDRLGALLGVRVLLAAIVVLGVGLVPGVLGEPVVRLLPFSAGFVLVTSGLEAVRRRARCRGLLLVRWLLLFDGLYVAVVVAQTGAAGSPLLFLVYLHVLACVLLASFRTGMALAVWHALLLLAVERVPWGSGQPASSGQELSLTAASFVLVGSAGVAFASLNERALRASRRAATDLVELGTALGRCRTLEDVTTAGVSHLRVRLGFERAAVLILGDEGCAGACDGGRGAVLVSSSVKAPLGGSGSRGTAPVLLTEPDAAWLPLLDDLLPDARNLVLIPMEADGAQVGVAIVESGPERGTLRTHELELLVQSVSRLALSVRTAHLLSEVERLAISDPLTRLANRRLFDTSFEREVARARRSRSPLGLVMIDVDHFKLVNDVHGHQAGDEVLRQLGAALQRAARKEDLVARYGGEEFVVLLPDATTHDALAAAERLRLAAGEVDAVPVTVSVGVASLSDVGDDGDGDGLIGAADQALYQAKAEGRNRVVRFAVEASAARSTRLPGH